jgi:hypothetical protein
MSEATTSLTRAGSGSTKQLSERLRETDKQDGADFLRDGHDWNAVSRAGRR